MAATPGAGVSGGSQRFLLAILIWSVPVFGILLASRQWMPPLASEHGAGIDRMLSYLMWSVGSLFVIGHGVLGYFVWRYGRAGKVTHRMATWKAERQWSLIPVVLMSLVAEGGVFALGLPVWSKYYGPPPPDAITIEVTGEQFAWNVRYAGVDGKFGRTDFHLIGLDNPVGIDPKDAAARDDILLPSVMYVPVNRPVRIRLRSKDTLHSFFLPHLRVKQDAVPGMNIDIWFVPTATGDFEIACAELCGFGHYQMRGVLHVVTSAEYEKWLREAETFF